MRKKSALALFAAAMVTLAACSDDDSGQSASSTTAAGASGNAALAEAKARVDAASVEPTGVGIEVPLSRVPDAGKNIYFLQCGVGVCKAIGDEHEAAAKLLGWNFTRIDMGTTPEQIVGAWNQVLEVTPVPDGVITSGVPSVVYESQLAELNKRGIPVVDYAATNATGDNGIIFDALPVQDNQARGRLMADFVAVESNCDATILFLNVPDYPVLVAEQVAFEGQMATLCPNAKTTVLNFAATDIGSAIPGAVVSHLQANPGTNWVVPSFDDMHLGVAEAVVELGRGDSVRMVSQNGAVHAVDNILNGRVQVASIPQGPGQVGYKVIDAFARHFNGDSLAPLTENLLPIWLQTKATITDPQLPWAGAPGYPDIFAKLWLVK
jgi:ABC-type sugar transport system substrate-binding protein